MILLALGLIAMSVITGNADYANWALLIAAGGFILFLLSGSSRSNASYFPLNGPIHVEALKFHCPEHGNFPVRFYSRINPPKCPTCDKTLMKGYKKK